MSGEELFSLIKRAVAEALVEHAAPRAGARFLTIGALARELGVSTRTVRRWLRAGELRSVRVGRQHRIERAEVQRFQREQGGGATTAQIDEQARRLLHLVPGGRGGE